MTYEDAIRGVFSANPELKPGPRWRFERFDGSWVLTDIKKSQQLRAEKSNAQLYTFPIELKGKYSGPKDLDGRDPDGFYLDNYVEEALLYYLDEEFAVWADLIPQYGYEGAWKYSAENLLKKSNYTKEDQLMVARCLFLHVIESTNIEGLEFSEKISQEELIQDYNRARSEYLDYLSMGSSDRDALEAETRLAARLSLEAHVCMTIVFGSGYLQSQLELPICESSWSRYGLELHEGKTIYARKNDFLAAWASIVCRKNKSAGLPIYEPWLSNPIYRNYLKVQWQQFSMPETMFDKRQPGVIALYQASNIDAFSIEDAFESYSNEKMFRDLSDDRKLPFIPTNKVSFLIKHDTIRIDFQQQQYVPLAVFAALDMMMTNDIQSIRIGQGSPLNSLLKNWLQVDGLAAEFMTQKQKRKRKKISHSKLTNGSDQYAQFMIESHIRAWQYWMMTHPKSSKKRWLKKQVQRLEDTYPIQSVDYGYQSPRYLMRLNDELRADFAHDFIHAQESLFNKKNKQNYLPLVHKYVQEKEISKRESFYKKLSSAFIQ